MERLLNRIQTPDWFRGLITSALLVVALWLLSGCSAVPVGPHERPAQAVISYGTVYEQLVVETATFDQHQPAGLAISEEGRVFVTFPYRDEQPPMSVAEVMPDGSFVAYPSKEWNRWDKRGGPSALKQFVSVQAICADDPGYLWVLDSGNPQRWRGVIIGGPKLVKISLEDDSIVDIYRFDYKRHLQPDSYLNDLRIDARRQTAYITDARDGAIIVLNLTTQQMHKTWLGLESNDTAGESSVEQPIQTQLSEEAAPMAAPEPNASVALSFDGDWLYFHTDSHNLMRVPTDVLRDREQTDDARADQVEHLGSVEARVDGIWLDERGSLYLATEDGNAILVREPSGDVQTFVAGDGLQRLDSLAYGQDGYLYATAGVRPLVKRYYAEELAPSSGHLIKVSPEAVAFAQTMRSLADEQHASAAWYAEQAGEAEALAALSEASMKALVRKARELNELADRAAAVGKADAGKLAEQARDALNKAVSAKEVAERERASATSLRQIANQMDEQAIRAERVASDALYAEFDARQSPDPETGFADVPTTTD